MTVIPVRTEPGPLTAEQHGHIAAVLGDARPASAELLMNFAALIRDRHDHPEWSDYRANLAAYMGENMGPVLRRLLDLEAENARLRTAPAGDLTPIPVHWDRLVMHPTGQDPHTIVCCSNEQGHPVALFLDDEHREALGLQLVEPDPDLPTPAQEEARARAYLAGATAGYGIQMHEWTGQDDGTAVYQSEDGITLVHTPNGPTPFVVTIPCSHHTSHAVQVTGQCSQRGPESPLTRFLQELADRYAEDRDEQHVTVIPGQVVRTIQHRAETGA
jgi:hypothetical protein